MKKLLLPGLFALVASQNTQAQLVGADAFMLGNYIEVGVAGTGGFEGAPWNSALPPVAGAHYRSGNPYFGFVANPQMDGWVNYDGDYFTPGTPENGWGFTAIDSGGTFTLSAGNNCAYLNEIPGSITSYNYSSGVHTVIWQGTYNQSGLDLDFTIEYNLNDIALTYTTTVSVVNNGSPLDELYYYRTLDPDNNQTISFDFVTTNTINSQPIWPSTPASVTAVSLVPWMSSFTFSSLDTMSRVCKGGFSNRNGADMWNGTGIHVGTVSSVSTADEAIAIACKWDSVFHFRSAYSFTFESTFAGSSITGMNETLNGQTQLYPNPTTGMLYISSAETVNEVLVYNVAGVLLFRAGNVSTVDLSAYDAGIYLVQVKTDKANLLQKIVKQ